MKRPTGLAGPARRALPTLDALESTLRGQLREVRADLHAELRPGRAGHGPVVGASVASLVFVGAVCLKQVSSWPMPATTGSAAAQGQDSPQRGCRRPAQPRDRLRS